MKNERVYSNELRKQQMAATQHQIVRAAIEVLTDSPGGTLSHDAVAAKAGVAVATVYRHFRNRAHLVRAMWQRFREEPHARAPETEAELVELAPRAFRAFDKHERLVRACLAVAAVREGVDRTPTGGRPAFMTALGRVTTGMTPPQRAQVVGIFLLLHNVSAWQTLRDEGQLSGQEAAQAVEWAARTLLDALGRGPAAKPAAAPLGKPQGPEVDSHR